MALELPIYMIVGEQPVSVEEVDGRLRIRGWSFAEGRMTQDAASWDDIVGHLAPGSVRRQAKFSTGSDTKQVTKKEFLAAVAELEAAAKR